MTAFEQLAFGYFIALAVAAFAIPVSRVARMQVVVAAGCLAGAAWLVGQTGEWRLRPWIPHVYLLAGYWLPAKLAIVPLQSTRLERALRQLDAKLAVYAPPIPFVLSRAAEAAYLLCYPIVPAAFAVVWWQGTRDDVTRFWVPVLAAGFACYILLPWAVSRPPRITGGAPPPRSPVRTLNVFVLDRFSHGLNTFPSGHVAVSCAAAGAVTRIDATSGAVLWVIAAGIAAGAVAGRYHYAADVIVGAAVGLAMLGLG